jgi:transposase
MRRRAYGAIRVNQVELEPILRGRQELAVTVGVDIGKFHLLAVARWADGRWERPWRIDNPVGIPALLALLDRLGAGRPLSVALESSGTYGDALRQALADQGVAVVRVSGKAACDYAEIFDGVPSQHDGKDAAVVAELAALGKATPWPYVAKEPWHQELAYWVDRMVSQRQLVTVWQGRLEGLLARHWPEATRSLRLSSGTLLRALAHYGSPQALAADPQASERLARWGGTYLTEPKRQALLGSAGTTVGVRPGIWEQRQLQDYARQALEARRQGQQAQRQLRRLADGHQVLQAQGRVVGVPTACVLWASTGDPSAYHCAGAYRKAMGLNLTERSSGTQQGPLHLSKRGSARSRQWLYFAVLRLVQRCGVRTWYQAKKARNPQQAKGALVAVMRKLAIALYHVGVQGQEFDAKRLFAAVVAEPAAAGRPEPAAAAAN